MKSLFIPLLLLLPLQSDNSVIKIEGLAAKYDKNQNIEFAIVNHDHNNKYGYFIGMEYCDDDGWRGLVTDITRPLSKSSLINDIKPQQKKTISLPLRKILDVRQFGFRLYRLKVVYLDSSYKVYKNYFSKSFQLVKKTK
ncbi:hypothetical protein ACFQZS_02770 [Mucilaginibacter calamicampi]|uniref:Beta-lactamase-inhibitor-like PepSY-like domain-containing protein n=1 Tax=Mucilaginibacter calamicampi TaxID=1302352 RepID=A0ABW2YRL9_9SPHI